MITCCTKHPTLPLGEFAIGTNTTAYVTAKKYGIEDKMPILIAEKMGPHFAVGDTCYSWCEDIKVYNPNGKRDHCQRQFGIDPQKKKMCQKHISIAIQILRSRMKNWAVLQLLQRIKKEITLLKNGKFVLPGTEILNEPLKNSNK